MMPNTSWSQPVLARSVRFRGSRRESPVAQFLVVRRHPRFMKNRTPLIIAALLAWSLAGCSKSGSGVQVISAVYGAGTNFADVSVQVGGLVRQSSSFTAQPTWLQTDPLPGYNKTLVIIYEVKGRRHIFTTPEGSGVSAAILLEAARQ